MRTPITDIDRKRVTKNAWRITNDRRYTCLRVRVPGGHLSTTHFDLVRTIADRYGNGTVHLTARQGLEVPAIRWEHRETINRLIRPLIEALDLKVDTTDEGYPAAGTRNVSACIGSRVCPFANCDTTRLAQRIERETYPNNLHFKMAVTGCPNDCIKAHMQDFGVIGMTLPHYEPARCISCNACVDTCTKRVTSALSMNDYDIERNDSLCIGCGECVKVCPTRAWTRSATKFYRLVIMGRTGKKNPRIASPFLKWASEEVIVGVIKNTYGFVDRHIDRSLAKEHIGYIVDRVGYDTFRTEALEGIDLNDRVCVAERIEWPGYRYLDDETTFPFTAGTEDRPHA